MTTNRCSKSDPAIGPPKGSRSNWIVSLTANALLRLSRGRRPVLDWLRHDADVRNARLFHRVHNRGECSEGPAPAPLNVDALMRGIDSPSCKPRRKVGQVHRLIVQEDLL